jgi:hypothetical protein
MPVAGAGVAAALVSDVGRLSCFVQATASMLRVTAA